MRVCAISACLTVAFCVMYVLSGLGVLSRGDETDKSWRLDASRFLYGAECKFCQVCGG